MSKTTQARVVSLGNFLLFGGIMFCAGWLIHQWICEWMSMIVEFNDLLSMGFNLFVEIIDDPGTPKSIGIWTTALVAILSGYLQLRKVWQQRK